MRPRTNPSAGARVPDGAFAVRLAEDSPGEGGSSSGWRGGNGGNGRVDVSEPASISTGIAGRYAQAVFDLAREENMLPAVGTDIDTLERALTESADLRRLIGSPLYTREEQAAAVDALAQAMRLSPVMRNVLGLMAQKRRLFVLPQFIEVLRERMSEARGEVAAEVVSAQPLSADQRARLTQTLSEKAGKAVRLRTRVDPTLIGGLVVRLGSRMIDTSIRAQLGRLQNMMKEAG